MNNDLLYCLHCKRIFKDTMRKYKLYKVQDTKREDSRHNPNYKNLCPYCLSVKTVNVDKLLLFGDNLKRDIGSLGNWCYRSLYVQIKKAIRKSRR